MMIPKQHWLSRSWRSDFSEAAISAGRGWPHVAIHAWGQRLVHRLCGVDRAVAAVEIDGGFRFELSPRLHAAYRALAPSSPLPSGEGGVRGAEHGALKEEIILLAKPETSVLEFDLAVPPGVSLHYQGELTPAEVERGCVRPPEIVGSLAVYGPFGEKLGHFYRPFATDADGKKTWCILRASSAVGPIVRLQLEVPQKFLDAARYPVVVDPTLGYSIIGGSHIGSDGNYVVAYFADTASASGTVSTLHWYITDFGASVHYTLGIYDSTPSALLKDTAGGTATVAGWQVLDLDSPLSVVLGTAYRMATNKDNIVQDYYDTVGGLNIWYAPSTYSAGVLPNPFPSATSASNYKHSMYGEITETPTGQPYVKRLWTFPLLGAWR